MIRRIGLLALMAAFVFPAYAQENYTQWSAFKAYRINTTNTGLNLTGGGGGNLLKFPLLIRLGAADSNVFKQSKGNGADVRFVKSDLSARLPHQIERWDSAGRNAAIWVLLDTLYTNNNTRTTRMYWGNPAAADSSNGAAVFDTAFNFLAVWHMSAANAADNEPDATPNGFTATAVSSPAVATGAVGGARTFAGGNNSGNNDYFNVQGSASGKLNFGVNARYTLSAWVQTNGNPSANRTVIQKHDRNWALQINGSTRWESFSYNNNRTLITAPAPVGDPSLAWGWQAAADTVSTAQPGWQHVVAVGDSLAQRLYVNGALAASNPGTDTTRYAGANSTARVDTTIVRIGKQAEGTGNNNRNWNGQLDEIRVERGARNLNYIRASYLTQHPFQTAVNALTPPAIAYTQASLSLEAGYAMLPVSPALVSGFPAVTFSVAPALPAGLSLNAATGAISGTPTAASAAANYVVTATNSEGTALDTINITVTAPAENYGSWTGTKTLTLNTSAAGGAGVAASQPFFPLLVRLTASADSAVFAQAKAGGADLRFSRPNGTRLRYQIEHWDATAKTASIWVQMDNVAGNAANDLRIHWGNAAANSQSSGPGVFAPAMGYQAVWHMDAAGTGNESDATGNGFTATAFGSPADSTGAVGRARQFNGTNQFFHVAGTASGALNFQMTDNYTFSAWIHADTIPAVASSGVQILNKGDNQYTMASYDNAASPKYWEITTRGNNAYLQARSNGTPNIPAHTTTKAWHHLAGTYRGGAVGQAIAETLYLDGVRINTLGAINSNNTGRNLTYDVHIGALAAGTAPGGGTSGATFSRYFVGRIDELQVANVTRGGDWVRLSYMTQKPGVAPVSNLTYASMSPNYTAGTAITANAPSVRGNVTRYTVSPALPAGLVLNDTTGVISGTPTAIASGIYTVTAWSDSVWTTSAAINLTVGVGTETYSTWGQHKDLYINTAANGAAVTGNVTRFPLLIRLNAANFNNGFAQSAGNGRDIRFTKLGDVVRLPHEIELWDSAGKQALIWVLVDTVRGNERNQRIRMHWSKPGVFDVSSGPAVFDTANGFVAVWHMNETITAVGQSLVDATANRTTARLGLQGTGAAPANATTGPLGVSKLFGGDAGSTNTNGAYFYVSDSSANALNLNTVNGPYTFTAWANPAVCQSGQRIAVLSKYNNNNVTATRAYTLQTAASGESWRLTVNPTSSEFSAATAGNEFVADAPCAIDTWQYVAGSYFSATAPVPGDATSAANVSISVNGDAPVTGTTADQGTGASIGNSGPVFIGRLDGTGNTNNRFMRGGLDELTVSKVRRSQDWIKLSYQTQRAGSNVVTDTLAPLGVAGGARFTGSELSVKPFGRGLLFQVFSARAGTARVSLRDMQGRVIWTHQVSATAGLNAINWDGRGVSGSEVSSGIYAVQISLVDAETKAVRTLSRTVPFTP